VTATGPEDREDARAGDAESDLFERVANAVSDFVDGAEVDDADGEESDR
jgi:hypothetical protein